MTTTAIHRVTRQHPCPICGKADWCNYLGTWGAHCMRVEQGSHKPANNGGWIHILEGHEADWREHLAAMPPPAPRPQMDLTLVNRAYRALLDCCPLSDDDRAGLYARGLTDAEIAGNFGTLPNDQHVRDRIVSAVTEAIGCDPFGVIPGFIHEQGRTQLVKMAGLLVAGWTADGLLGSFQVRVKHPGAGGKYLHLSDSKTPGSMSADGHFVNVSRPQRPVSHRIVIGTEGFIKGLVIATRLGRVTASVPGVHNTGKLVATLQDLGDVEEVWMAYDADRETNPHVAAAESKTVRDLQAAGFAVKQLLWPAEYGKGLDDALQNGVIPVAIPHPALSTPRQDTASENTEDLAELRRRHALTQAAHRSPNLGAERHTLVDFATMLATHPEDEWVPMPYARIGEQANIDARTAERHLKAAGIRATAAEAGVLAGLVEVKLDEVPERVNERTGQIVGGYKAMYVRRLAPVPELLQRIATAPPSAKGKRNGHGGRREPCWKCGATDIERTITDRCAGCGELINQTVRIITGDEETPHVKMTPTPLEAESAPDICSSAVTVYRGDNLPPTPPRQDDARLDRLERARLHLIGVQARCANAEVPPVEAQQVMDLVAEPVWIDSAPDPIEPDMSCDDDYGIDAPLLYEAQEVLTVADHGDERARQDVGAQLERMALSRGRQPVPKSKSSSFNPPDPWAEYAPMGAD